MKTLYRLILSALLPLAGMSLVSCSSIDATSTMSGRVDQGVPGGHITRTTTVDARVTAIDGNSRKVSLVTPQGKKFKVTAGPEVANFNQIQVGDRLKATYIEESIIRMAKPGEKVDEGTTIASGSAPLGAKPGALAGESHQYVGTVTAIDTAKRTASLRFADGTSATFPVRDDVDMTKGRIGDRVVFRTTEAVAIGLAKP